MRKKDRKSTFLIKIVIFYRRWVNFLHIFSGNYKGRIRLNDMLRHFFPGREQNNKMGQHDALRDVMSCRDICNEASLKLGFDNYQSYLEDYPSDIIRPISGKKRSLPINSIEVSNGILKKMRK